MSESKAQHEALKDGEALKTITPEDEAQKLVNGMPEVQNYVENTPATMPVKPPQTHADNPKPINDKTKGLTDRYKRPFDPKLHRVKPDGSPVVTRNGNLQMIERRGKKNFKKMAKNGQGDTLPPGQSRLDAHYAGGPEAARKRREETAANASPDASPNTAAPVDASRQFTAAMLVGVLVSTGQAIFDADEWKPSEFEQAALNDATAKWLESQGVSDVPPGWALVGAVAMYALPRLAMEKTQAKIGKIIEKVSNKGPKTTVLPDPETEAVDAVTREQFEASNPESVASRDGFLPPAHTDLRRANVIEV